MSLIIGHVNLSQSWGEEPCAPPSPVQVLVTSICSLNLNICFLSCKILLAWPVFEKVTAFFCVLQFIVYISAIFYGRNQNNCLSFTQVIYAVVYYKPE